MLFILGYLTFMLGLGFLIYCVVHLKMSLQVCSLRASLNNTMHSLFLSAALYLKWVQMSTLFCCRHVLFPSLYVTRSLTVRAFKCIARRTVVGAFMVVLLLCRITRKKIQAQEEKCFRLSHCLKHCHQKCRDFGQVLDF